MMHNSLKNNITKKLPSLAASFFAHSAAPSTPSLSPKTTLVTNLTLIKNKKIVPPQEEKLIPKPTKADGDCAFHAVFGKWNGQEYFCEDAIEKRKQVQKAIEESKPASEIYGLAIEGIKSLIMNKTASIGTNYSALFLVYQTQVSSEEDLTIPKEQPKAVFDWNSQVNPATVNEYAHFLSRPGQWLSPSDLAIIAHTFNVTIIYYPHRKAKKMILNPGNQKKSPYNLMA